MRVLITGGAGFVGSRIASALKQRLGNEVVVLDNLRRRGSEINLTFFRKSDIPFYHGDIRQRTDLEDLPGSFDLIIEASAEPSVLAGQHGSPAYVIGTNLTGTLNCLEFSRRRAGLFLYLSTSRVYSIASLRSIRLRETSQRFEIEPQQNVHGVSEFGISEDFPTNQARSFYGATKLASELLIQEYAAAYGLKALINRCGVIAGSGQFGKVDQGVVSLWVAHHYYGMPLAYNGFGGSGKQVRDLMHPSDLVDLLFRQLEHPECWEAMIFNAGGGRSVSVSLKEMTQFCCEAVGRSVPVGSVPETESVDVPIYITDYRNASKAFGWHPQRSVKEIIAEILDWIRSNEEALKPIFGVASI